MKRSSVWMAGVVVGSLAMAGASQASLIATDSFASGSATVSGTGWGSDWTAGGALTATGLSYPGVTSTGVAATRGTASNFKRAILTIPNDGLVYNSFLLKANTVNGTNNYTSLTFYKNYDTELFGTGVVWNGSGSSAEYGSWVKGASAFFIGGTTAVDDSTHLVIQVIDTTANNVKVYLDPNLSGGTLPATASWSFDTADLSSVNVVRLEFGANNAIDEIRIGTALEDVVTVVPEPASLALLAVGGLMIARRRRA